MGFNSVFKGLKIYLTSTCYRISESMELYIHSPTHLHGVKRKCA